VDVVLLRWPAESERRARLAEEGRPRLLLVDEAAVPPAPDDCLEDWVRIPASEVDVRARVEALLIRSSDHLQELPVLDQFGMLRHGEGLVALPPVEARLMGVLVERIGAVASRDVLSRAGWPAGMPGRNALDVHLLRLRRRVAPLDLVIRTVRSRGYLLERPGPRRVELHG
jgi:DNA-binding response OmpR family regulator